MDMSLQPLQVVAQEGLQPAIYLTAKSHSFLKHPRNQNLNVIALLTLEIAIDLN